MAARMTNEELRASARAAGLSASEEEFVCFDWANSETWQEYLSNLYPTPPLNKLLKWKKKFYKARQDPAFDVNSTKVDEVLSGEAKHSYTGPQSGGCCWNRSTPYLHRVGNPPSARALTFLNPLTLMCLLAGMARTVIAAAASARDPVGSLLLAGALVLRIYCCFGSPPIQLWPISQVGDSVVNQGLPYFQQVQQSDAAHGVLFFLLTGLMPNSLPLVGSPLLTGCLVLAQIFREGSGLPSFLITLGPVRSFAAFFDRKRFQVLQLRADLEVYYGVFFVVVSIIRMNISLSEFLLPAYLYWQLQKLRFQLSPYSQSTFRRIDAIITSLTSNPSCPWIVSRVYNMIRNFCVRQVQLPEPTPAGQSASCTIM